MRSFRVKSKKISPNAFHNGWDPNIEITCEVLLKLQENGADLIELGIPYSDPLADGPVIQVAASRALKSELPKKGYNLESKREIKYSHTFFLLKSFIKFWL